MICYGLWQKTIIYVVCVGLKLQNDNKKNKSQNSAGNIGNIDWKFYDVFLLQFQTFFVFIKLIIVSRIYWFYREFKEKMFEKVENISKSKKPWQLRLFTEIGQMCWIW